MVDMFADANSICLTARYVAAQRDGRLIITHIVPWHNISNLPIGKYIDFVLDKNIELRSNISKKPLGKPSGFYLYFLLFFFFCSAIRFCKILISATTSTPPAARSTAPITPSTTVLTAKPVVICLASVPIISKILPTK